MVEEIVKRCNAGTFVSIKVDVGGDSFTVSVLEDTVPVSNSKILQWLGLDKMELDGVSNFESKNKKVSQGGGVKPIKAIVTTTRKAVTFQNSSRSLTVDRVVESPNVTRIEEGVIDAAGKKRRSKNNGFMASARKSHSMMLRKERSVDSSVAGGDSNLGRSFNFNGQEVLVSEEIRRRISGDEEEMVNERYLERMKKENYLLDQEMMPKALIGWR
ncbi:hypothetical protein LWI28_017332 [Acer negundo]|uniref:Uncharacterized protein n=1 Tax=Acer negundo TaxID=4023 RepID=A0AAD5J6I7_ACENE|nr:hypothetical protein LWI28_017332 [Acer negundo]